MSKSVLLYGRATSSSSFRVRIALNLAGIEYDTDTLTGEEQGSGTRYSKINPQVTFCMHQTCMLQ